MEKVLIICGGPNTGKTELALALMNASGISGKVQYVTDNDLPQFIPMRHQLLIVDRVTKESVNKWCAAFRQHRQTSPHESAVGISLILLTQHIPEALEIELSKKTRVYHVLRG